MAEAAVDADGGTGVPDPDGEVTDPAAEAARCQQAAQDARERATAAMAEAQAEAQRIIAAAEREATGLELKAREADEDAAYWQGEADRDAKIGRLEAELARVTELHGRLAQEAVQLEAAAAAACGQLEALAARRRDAEQRRADARSQADVDGVQAAVAELAAVDEVMLSESSRREQAEARLAQIRGNGGELGQLSRDIARTAVELGELRRERDGLPRRAEVAAVAQQLLSIRVAGLLLTDSQKLTDAAIASAQAAAAVAAAGQPPEEAQAAAEAARAQMAEAIKAVGEAARLNPASAGDHLPFLVIASSPVLLPELITWLEGVAASDLEAYEQVAATAFRRQPAAPESFPSLREMLAEPALTTLSDGTLRYEPGYQGWGRTGHVPAPEPGFAGGL